MIHLYEYHYRDQRSNLVTGQLAFVDDALTPEQSAQIRAALEADEYFIPADLTDADGMPLGLPELQASAPKVPSLDTVVWHLFDPFQTPKQSIAVPSGAFETTAAAWTDAFAAKPRWNVIEAMNRLGI